MPLRGSCVERQSADTPDWQVAIIDGQPEIVLNRAVVEAPITHSPLGEREARRRLAAAGYRSPALDHSRVQSR